MENFKEEKGFTLLEVLLSIVILSIIILSFLSFFSQALLHSVREEDNLTSMNIADTILYSVDKSSIIDLLEENPNRNFSCLSPLSISSYLSDDLQMQPDASDPEKLVFNINNKDYFTYIDICQTASEETLNLYRLHIRISQPLKNESERFIYDTFHYINRKD
ncbi:prepilin-type N-terminal cleavage/methylation domain-containing protein [Sutcliffiella horikoshii]|uniref:prepilin-type N-terminal cleavage/methylation domain-containing protein n=1 Tax=Sutcliffiella horikoshii TaxID=79883 RepID=UPI001CBC081E|nr:prepilin-type N-terminal cleavage/methylation domain-containing protein [Sutcliffiella horikoshii]UAL46329.1 prepilin-type N-terminal cleavage/methylation domain-containing protein [Sutcliffiella horikoshii]